MQQTLFALCAVAVFAIYALNSTRDEAAAEMRSVTAETEKAAEAVARARLAAADRFAFDEQDVGRDGGVRIVAPTSTPGIDDGEDAADITTFDDLDDFNGFAEVRAADAVGGAGLTFDVVYAVRYVVPGSAPLATSLVPTLAKELTVRATEVTAGRRTGRPVGQVTLRKVFTPAAMASSR